MNYPTCGVSSCWSHKTRMRFLLYLNLVLLSFTLCTTSSSPSPNFRLISSQRPKENEQTQTKQQQDIQGAIERCIEARERKPTLDEDPQGPSFCLGLLYMAEKSFILAIEAFETALVHCPSNAPAHFNKAMSHQQLFDFGAAIDSYRICLSMDSTRKEAEDKIVPLLLKDTQDSKAREALSIIENALANTDIEQGRYIQLIELKAATYHRLKDYKNAYSIYSNIVEMMKKSYRDLDSKTRMDAKDVNSHEMLRAYQNAATAAEGIGEMMEAEKYYLEALATDEGSQDANTWTKYGIFLKYAERKPEAIAALRKALEIDPDETASETSYGIIQLAALVGGLDRSSMGEKYIEDLFNGYANRFETELCDTLQYKGHVHVCAAAAKWIKSQGGVKVDAVFDLGCGTGLCGPLLKSAIGCKTLVGVDLSKEMLSKALTKNVYNRLVISDILDFLKSDVKDASVDMLVAADVFIYIGDLEKVFAQASRVLLESGPNRKGGLFVFTIEDLDSDYDGIQNLGDVGAELYSKGYYLLDNGRFGHRKNYIRQISDKHSFEVIEMKREILRLQNGKPVNSFTVVLQKS